MLARPAAFFAHAVKHAGDGDEMGRFIVKALVGLEHLKQGDGAGAKERMGSENDQEYGHKEVEQRIQGRFAQDGDGIASAQAEQAEDRGDGGGLGLLLPRLGGLHQLHGSGLLHRAQVGQQDEREDARKHQTGLAQGFQAHLKGQGGRFAQQAQQEQEHQLSKEHAERQPHPHAHKACKEGLQQQYQGDMPLLHAQYGVQAQLLHAALDEKTVGIVQHDGRKNADHQHAQKQDGLHGGGVAELGKAPVDG